MAKWIPEKISGIFQRVRTPTEETLLKLLDPNDARTQIRPLGNDWMCPFTGMRIVLPKWDGRIATLLEHPEVTQYLSNVPEIQKRGERAQMQPWDRLVTYAVALRLRESPYYRVCSDKGLWICPHCLMITDVLLEQWDGTHAPMDWFLPQAWGHLLKCQAYRANPLAPRSPEEVLNSHGERGIRMELLKRVAQDPLYRVTDDMGTWICPFTKFPVPSINLSRTPWSPAVQEQIVEYMLSPQCPARYSNWTPEITLVELQRIAGRVSATHSHRTQISQAEAEVSRLRERVDELGKTADDTTAELEAARRVQLQMLPSKPPEIQGYDINAFYTPCVHLGGDLYQFYEITPNHTGLMIGDVSGHGAAAAVIMAMATKSCSVRSARELAPAAVLKAVNIDLVQDLQDGKFITAFYAILEHLTGTLRYVRAGHPPPYIIQPDGRVEPLTGSGMALGVADAKRFDTQLHENVVVLQPDATLVMYTDGIIEAMNAEKQEFGSERLQELLSECVGLSAQDTSLAILSAVRAHAGSASLDDDVTLVVVRHLPQ
ncbi:MAG TPA: PP2C family protein-serine/threonine phosphatase [Planctomycetota bacterium]|nr:PP2C family protein-serine/threonine phosphatase [Planctomycetota bacterium]